MSLFRRNRRGSDEESASSAEGQALDTAAGAEPASSSDAPDEELLDDDGQFLGDDDIPADDPFDRAQGPWDAAEVADTEGYLDLGSLRVRGPAGMHINLEVDEAAGRVTSATLQIGSSAVQLQAFAAPRSSGIWAEIRADIAEGIARQNGTADEVPGPFGRELLARIPVRTPDGRSGQQAIRFTGVDGPRWFLRAVFHGAAAYDAAAAAELEQVVRDVVVVRGPDAMAPRDLLELRLPDAAGPAEPAEEQRPGIDPFERGPEITEIH